MKPVMLKPPATLSAFHGSPFPPLIPPSQTHVPSSSSSITHRHRPVSSLEEGFGRKGIKFSESGDVPTVELTVRNMSSLRLRIPDGIVTSYKPKVYWKDDGFEEVLYTIGDGASSVKGGLGLVLNGVSADGSEWSISEWLVKDSDSDSIDAVQVELSCTNVDGSLDITYIVSLYPLSMATAVIVQNNGTESVKLTSGMLGYLRFKSKDGSAIQGLRGCCSYCSYPPLDSSFGLLSSSDEMEPDPPGWFSFLGSPPREKVSTEIYEPEAWKVEDNLYTILKRKLSRVYAAPPSERTKRIYNTSPSKYQTIDQGSGLGFRVIRMGYEDIYIGTPGSFFQKYGKDNFICTGSASMLVPEVLEPGDEWRAAQGSGLGFRVMRMGYEDIYIGTPGSFFQKYGKDYFICTGSASMLVPEVLEPGDEWRAAQVIEHDNL